MCFSITMGRSAIGAEQLLFASSERPSTKEKSSQNHGCANRFCANKKMLARQSRYVPPCTCGNKSSKRCRAQALPAHHYRRRNFLQKWLPVRPSGPRRARPCSPSRGPRIGPPRRRKSDPVEPENQKSANNFRYHFQVRFLDLKIGSFFGFSQSFL